MVKVVCKFCTKYENGRCTSKGATTDENKRRMCSKYAPDTIAIASAEFVKKNNKPVPTYKATFRYYDAIWEEHAQRTGKKTPEDKPVENKEVLGEEWVRVK